MTFNIRCGIAFDDVLLVPQYSEIESRANVDISFKMGEIKYTHPIIPANMKTILGVEMASEIIESGGLAIMHRFLPIEKQLNIIKDLIKQYGVGHIAVSIGIKKEDRTNLEKFYELGVEIVCIDVAHGDSVGCINMISWIKIKYPDIFIIAGNVATGQAAKRLWVAGADAVKVGIGPGSLCTTRIETGNGVPQLTALMEVAAMKMALTDGRQSYVTIEYGITTPAFPQITRPLYIIADGGIKSSGDIVKALCFADMVMIGNMFAGCVETPGNIISIDGREYKEYVGSSTHKANHVEGVAAMVATKGKFKNILNKMLEGLRSGCSYQGANNLIDIKYNPQFIRITNAGLVESHPHDVRVIK